jgi:hypothetical protein
MKKAVFVLLSVVLVAFGILYFKNYSKKNFKDKFADNLSRYKQDKAVLLLFKDSIKQKILAQEHEPWRSADTMTIFYGNKSYFENTILKSNQTVPELKKILLLWEDGLIQNNDTGGGDIWLDDDNTVGFNVKSYYGWFFMPSIMHYIVYDPKHKFVKDKNNYPFEVIQQKELDKDWIYVIVKKYFDD